MIVTVHKKINTKFYRFNNQPNQYQNKFIPDLFNPNSGNVILDPLSKKGSYDFHLAAQYVTQGTCNPTLYRVAYDKTNMPEEAIISFTYEQCFNYYNWQGPVKVPACLQNADKLSKLVSMYLKSSVEESVLCNKHYFL